MNIQSRLAEANSVAEEMVGSMTTVKAHGADEFACGDPPGPDPDRLSGPTAARMTGPCPCPCNRHQRMPLTACTTATQQPHNLWRGSSLRLSCALVDLCR